MRAQTTSQLNKVSRFKPIKPYTTQTLNNKNQINIKTLI